MMFKSYKKWQHISDRKFRDLLRYFSEDINAFITSRLSGVSIVTINKIYLEIRKTISLYCEFDSVFEAGEIEIDESYWFYVVYTQKKNRLRE